MYGGKHMEKGMGFGAFAEIVGPLLPWLAAQ
jgi:hypothetical protein